MSLSRNISQFRIPRKEAELLKTLTEDDDEKNEIEKIISESFFDAPRANIQYSLTGIQLINNKKLEANCNEKKHEMESLSPPLKPFSRFCFYRAEAHEVETIAKNGFECKKSDEIDFKLLGSTEHGVYLCKHMDIFLQREATKNTKTLYCIVVKTLLSIPASYVALAKIRADDEPDNSKTCCHSKDIPVAGEKIDTNYPKSLVFVYDYQMDTLDLRTKYPENLRNLVPYAVLKYELKSPASAKPRASFRERAMGMIKSLIAPIMPRSSSVVSLKSFNNLAVSGRPTPPAGPVPSAQKHPVPPSRPIVPERAKQDITGPSKPSVAEPVPLGKALASRPTVVTNNAQPKPKPAPSQLPTHLAPSSSHVPPKPASLPVAQAPATGVLPMFTDLHGIRAASSTNFKLVNTPFRPKAPTAFPAPFAQSFQAQYVMVAPLRPQTLPLTAGLRPPLRMHSPVLSVPLPAPVQAPQAATRHTRPVLPPVSPRFPVAPSVPLYQLKFNRSFVPAQPQQQQQQPDPRVQNKISTDKDPRLNRRYFSENLAASASSQEAIQANRQPETSSTETQSVGVSVKSEAVEKDSRDEEVTVSKSVETASTLGPTPVIEPWAHETSLISSQPELSQVTQTSSNIRLLLASYCNSTSATRKQMLARQSDACRLNTNFAASVTTAGSVETPATSDRASEDGMELVSDDEDEETAADAESDESEENEEESEDDVDAYDLYVKFYGEIAEFEERTPRWRIIYEETGRMDTKFRGERQLLVKMDKLRLDDLKFTDEEATTVDLKEPANRAAVGNEQQQPPVRANEGGIPYARFPHVAVFSKEKLENIRKMEALRAKDDEVRNELLEKIARQIEELRLQASVKQRLAEDPNAGNEEAEEPMTYDAEFPPLEEAIPIKPGSQ